MTWSASDDMAASLAELLRRHQQAIVFAESCTAGLIAATLGRIAGISEWLAGSAVVYQVQTKAEWLGVDRNSLTDPGPVSRMVSEQMALGVLERTPQATIAASVTGYLGPDSPADQDGVAWSSIAFKTSTDVTVTSRRLYPDNDLSGVSTKRMSALELRHVRQVFAAQQVLQFCVEHFPRCV